MDSPYFNYRTNGQKQVGVHCARHDFLYWQCDHVFDDRDGSFIPSFHSFFLWHCAVLKFFLCFFLYMRDKIISYWSHIRETPMPQQLKRKKDKEKEDNFYHKKDISIRRKIKLSQTYMTLSLSTCVFTACWVFRKQWSKTPGQDFLYLIQISDKLLYFKKIYNEIPECAAPFARCLPLNPVDTQTNKSSPHHKVFSVLMKMPALFHSNPSQEIELSYARQTLYRFYLISAQTQSYLTDFRIWMNLKLISCQCSVSRLQAPE